MAHSCHNEKSARHTVDHQALWRLQMLTKRQSRITLALFATICLSLGYLYCFHPTLRFKREWMRTEQIIEGVREPVPEGISEHAWDNLWSAIRASYGNGIYTVGYATREQVHQLGIDIQAIDASPLPPIEKAKAMWDRIGQTAPKAAAYNERFSYMMNEAVAFAESERTKAVR